MNNTDLDPSLVNKMRQLARENVPIAAIIKAAKEEPSRTGTDGLLMLRYFMEAVKLRLADALIIQGSRAMGNAAITDDELELQLRPKMKY